MATGQQGTVREPKSPQPTDGSTRLERLQAVDRSRGRRMGVEATYFDELTACYERMTVAQIDPHYTKEDVVKMAKDMIAMLITKCLATPHIGSQFSCGGDEADAMRRRKQCMAHGGVDVPPAQLQGCGDGEQKASAGRGVEVVGDEMEEVAMQT